MGHLISTFIIIYVRGRVELDNVECVYRKSSLYVSPTLQIPCTFRYKISYIHIHYRNTIN